MRKKNKYIIFFYFLVAGRSEKKKNKKKFLVQKFGIGLLPKLYCKRVLYRDITEVLGA